MTPAAGSLHLVPVPIAQSARGSGHDAAGDGAPEAAVDAAAAAAQVLPDTTLAVARTSRYFLVENARSARAFLKAIGHPEPIAQLRIVEIGHAPDPAQIDDWLAPLRARAGAPGIDAVVLSEAGCPGIADPGATLVARAHSLGIAVRPWVGPSSILLALMGAGLNGQQFRFLGYLPQEADALLAALRAVQRDALRGETQIFIETPYRNARLFGSLLSACAPELLLCVAADLTTPGQQLRTLSIAQWRALPPSARPQLDRRPAVFLLGGTAQRPAGPVKSGHSRRR